jgi:hypothetical protein
MKHSTKVVSSAGGWGKLRNEELRNLCSTRITRMIKSRNEMGRAYVIYRREVHTKFWWENLKDTKKKEDTDARRIILK